MEISRVKRYVAQHSFQIQHRKRNKPSSDLKATKAVRTGPAKKSRSPKGSRPKRTPLTPEQKRQRERDRWKDRYERAKSLGICRNCDNPAIPGQTRCEDCADKHRVSRRANDKRRRAAAKRSAEQKTLTTETAPNPSDDAYTSTIQTTQVPETASTKPATLSPRQQYERLRKQRPERKESSRKAAQERRERAKALGLCCNCSSPAIPGQAKCQSCTEKHKGYRRKSAAAARARQKAQRDSNRQG